MLSHRFTGLPLLAFSALVLCSCVIKDGRPDFTWWKDAAAPVMEDDVVIESGGGYYHSTPAPERVPLASIPKESPEPTPAAASPPTAPGFYVVQPGDTLTAIARRYRTSVSALVTANNLAGPNAPLRVNKTLRIPSNSVAATTPPATPKAKPIAATPAPAAKPVAHHSTGGSYTVKAGDTLYKISRMYRVSPAALMQANGLTPTTANTIHVGSVLQIPSTN